MNNRTGSEMAVNLIAVMCNEDDPEILSDGRFDERITIFEEFACGGLEIIKELLDRSASSAREVLLQLIEETLLKDETNKVLNITDAIDTIFR